MPDWHDILKFLAGVLTGFCLKWYFVYRSEKTSIKQSGNVVGGNMAGGDVNIDTRKR